VVVPVVAVVGPNILPKPNTLRDIFDQFAFLARWTLLAEDSAEGRSG
jgi:hypothetical protein